MKVKLTRNTVVAGEVYEVGDVVEASTRDANYLMAIGKAVLAKPRKEADPVPPDGNDEPPAPVDPEAELAAEKAESMDGVIATTLPGGKRHGRK